MSIGGGGMMWKEGGEKGDLLFDHSGGDVSIYTI